MLVLFDLQDKLRMDASSLLGCILPTGSVLPTLIIEQVEDVKTILVTDRGNTLSGIGLSLPAIPEIRAGDRVTVTGRFKADAPAGSWGVALFSGETDESRLAHQVAPKPLFALSHILDGEHVNKIMPIHTTRWGAINPVMDFYLDNIMVSRQSARGFTEDSRRIVYSLATDEGVQSMGEGVVGNFGSSPFLVRAGGPALRILRRGGRNAFHVGSRARDFDAADLNMAPMGLITGNQYRVSVTGRIDGPAPEGTLVMLQGIPGFNWRGAKVAAGNKDFTLTHTLTPSEAGKWTAIRITTNNVGAAVPFYVYGIEVERLDAQTEQVIP